MNLIIPIGSTIIFLRILASFLNLTQLIVLASRLPRTKFNTRHDFDWTVATSA